MRLLLLTAALGAAAALAAPAHAAQSPVCGVVLADAAAGTARTCTAANDRAVVATHATRRLDVVLVSGVVDVSLSCSHPYGSYPPVTKRLSVPGHDVLRATERIGYPCVATLVAVSDGATAQGESTFVYRLPFD